ATAWANHVLRSADQIRNTGKDSDGRIFGTAAVLLDAVGMTTEADTAPTASGGHRVISGAPVGGGFPAADRREEGPAAPPVGEGGVVDELREVLGEDRPARKAYLLSEAVRTLRRLHDGRAEVWANEVLALLDDPSFDEEYAMPAILTRLAEAEQNPGRLLTTA